jgi:hypothetical protein
MSRSTDRAFSRLISENEAKQQGHQLHGEACMHMAPPSSFAHASAPSLPKDNTSAHDQEPCPASTSAPSAPIITVSSDAEIRRILSQWEKKEYFDILKMPPPSVDELGRPVSSLRPSRCVTHGSDSLSSHLISSVLALHF